MKNANNQKKNITMISLIILIVVALGVIVFFFIRDFKGEKVGSGSSASVEEKNKSAEIMDDFYKYMESEDEKVIYFGSSTCSYCELQTPIMEQIEKDYDIDYLYIDANKLVDSDKDKLLEILDIEGSTPTISVVKRDSVIDTNVGYLEGQDLVKFLIENDVLEDDAVYTVDQYLTYINYSEYEEIVKRDDSSVIVIGQSTCGHCIAAKPVLSHIAGKYDITINYLNLTNLTEDEQNNLVSSLKEIGYTDAENLGTPLTIIVRNNKLESTIEGENPTSYFVRAFKKAGVIEE